MDHQQTEKQLLAELGDELQQMEKKYFDLVWYERSRRHEHLGLKPEVLEGIRKAEARVECSYPPDEIEPISPGEQYCNWKNGFNNGMLAAMRFVMTAIDDGEAEDEFGEKFPVGGIDIAKNEFPLLDT